MSGEQNISILGIVRNILGGRIEGSDLPEDAALARNRALMVWSPLIGFDGTRERTAALGAGAELKSLLMGQDAAGANDELRIDSNDRLEISLLQGGYVQVDPVLIPNAEGLLWNPATTSADIYEVFYKIVNSTSSAVTGVNIGQDIGAGGALSAVEYWEQGLIIPGNGTSMTNASQWLGGHIMPGDDRIRGVAGTNNVLSIHWKIRKLA